jgi:5-methylcytosine-specific restriction protein A
LDGQPPLQPAEFSGGEATVQSVLEKLGFEVVQRSNQFPPTPGDILTNDQVASTFIVGNMGGMRRSTARNLLVLISDPFKGLYLDRWDGEILHYTGMGPTGHQSLTYAQNRTLAESTETGIPVHLLEALEPLKYTYAGQVELVKAPYQEEQLDDTGAIRQVWMFPIKLKLGGLIPSITEKQARGIEEAQARRARRLSTEELRGRADRAKKRPTVRMAQVTVFVRDAAVAELAKRFADGTCDLCDEVAPFQNRASEPYLECHHIVWLANGGLDVIANTVALCPNCHRKMHVLNSEADRQKLTTLATVRAAGPA